MRTIFAAMVCIGAISPSFAGEPQPDPRLDLRRSSAGAVVGHAPAASLVTTSSAVRIFARQPRPDFAPLAAAPRPASATPPIAAAGIDDAAFWRAVGAGDAAAADGEYHRLTASIAPWPAAAAAKAVLDQLTFDRDMTGAADRQDWDRIAALQIRFPAQFTCDRIGNMWAAADAHRHRGNMPAAADIYAAIVEGCTGDDRILALRRAVDHLPPTLAAAVLRGGADTGDAALIAAAGNLTYDLARNGIITAFDAGDDATVRHLSQTNEAAITLRRDAEVALFVAWSADRSATFDVARDWFARALTWQPSTASATGVVEAALRDGDLTTAERVTAQHLEGTPNGARMSARIRVARANELSAAGEDAGVVALARQARGDNIFDADLNLLAGYASLRLGDPGAAADHFAAADTVASNPAARLGLARARVALDDLDGAGAIIDGLSPTAETVAIAAEIDMRRATAAFDARDYAVALTHAQGAQRSPDFALAGLELEAWSLFGLKRYGIAAELFENLYSATPTEAIAEGLYQSLTRINRPARLRRIAQETEGPLDRRLRWQGVVD